MIIPRENFMALQPLTLPRLRLNYFAPTTPRHPFIRTIRFDKINQQPVITCSAGTRVSETEVQRRLPNYQPTSWSYDFLQSLKPDHKVNSSASYMHAHDLFLMLIWSFLPSSACMHAWLIWETSMFRTAMIDPK